MDDEYNALVKNGTWILVPRPTVNNLVLTVTRLSVQWSSQPPSSQSLVLQSLALWTPGTLTMYAFCRSLYMVVYLLIHVDDIILTASSTYLLQQVITSLHNEFDMTDLEALNYFLVQHQRTKHIEIDIHFVRDLVTASQVRVLHVLSRYQILQWAALFTKKSIPFTTSLAVIHPLRKEFHALPPVQRWLDGPCYLSEVSWGHGFDVSTSIFKMVCVSSRIDCSKFPLIRMNLCTMVHALGKDDSWREIPQVPSYPTSGDGTLMDVCIG
nr:hypothetical protein [Tanacetum cinerariifolium]